MKFATAIPDALHICPLCEALASGPELCAGCRQFVELTRFLDAQLRAKRSRGLYDRLPRVRVDPPSRRWPDYAMLCAFLLYGVIVMGGFGWVAFQALRWMVR